MKFWLLLIALVILGCEPKSPTYAATPAGEEDAVLRDLRTLPSAQAITTRYLTVYNIAKEKRWEVAQVASATLNFLSRSRKITKPVQVSSTLFRFNARSYAPTDKELGQWLTAWHNCVLDDPYFHLKGDAVDPSDNKQKTITAAGGWLNPRTHAEIKAITGEGGTVLRADFFVAIASAPPRYYEFAGIPPKETDFLKALGVDIKVIEELRANTGANLIQSNITHKNRRVIFSQGPLGGVYETLDMNQVTADRDVLRRPIDDQDFKLKYDAGEWFAVAPNGLWRNALYDSQGNRQDAVPDAIAKDDHGDGRIVPFVSCIRCHQESGLRPFRDDQKILLQGVPGKPGLYSYKPELIERTLEFYDEELLLKRMQIDRDRYDLSLRRCTEYSPAEFAVALTNVVQAFLYDKVSPADAARELGITNIEFLHKTRDPVLLLLIEGRGVLRGQFESAFSEASLAIEQWRISQVRYRK